MLLVNLYGGPGTGKSTTATGVFSKLKLAGVNAEYVPEFAKDLTWEERYNTMNNQLYIFAKQFHRLWRLKDKVDVIITDSPLLFSLVYGEPTEAFTNLVLEKYREFNNLDIFLNRVKEYNHSGRSQTERESLSVDLLIAKKLLELDIFGNSANGDEGGIDQITSFVLNELG